MTTKRIIYEGRVQGVGFRWTAKGGGGEPALCFWVQGVGFRWTAKELARGYDVLGTVRNLPDGTVEMVVAGERGEVAEFLRDLREDSAVAHHIKGVLEEEIDPLPELKGFTIVA